MFAGAFVPQYPHTKILAKSVRQTSNSLASAGLAKTGFDRLWGTSDDGSGSRPVTRLLRRQPPPLHPPPAEQVACVPPLGDDAAASGRPSPGRGQWLWPARCHLRGGVAVPGATPAAGRRHRRRRRLPAATNRVAACRDTAVPAPHTGDSQDKNIGREGGEGGENRMVAVAVRRTVVHRDRHPGDGRTGGGGRCRAPFLPLLPPFHPPSASRPRPPPLRRCHPALADSRAGDGSAHPTSAERSCPLGKAQRSTAG